jgi:hypothetical protein
MNTYDVVDRRGGHVWVATDVFCMSCREERVPMPTRPANMNFLECLI